MLKCGDCSYFKSARDTVHKEWKMCSKGCVMKSKTRACRNFKFPSKLKLRIK